MGTVAFIPAGSFSITPHNTNALTQTAYGLYAAGAGTVSFVDIKGNTHSRTLAAGGEIIMQVGRVNATGTTATGIEGYIVD